MNLDMKVLPKRSLFMLLAKKVNSTVYVRKQRNTVNFGHYGTAASTRFGVFEKKAKASIKQAVFKNRYVK